MDKKALHEELHRLIERKKQLYAEKDRLYDKLSSLKAQKQAAHRRASERVTTAGPFGWFFGTTHSDKQNAFRRAKSLGHDMDWTYSQLCTVKGKLKHVRAQINDLKDKLFNGK